jgi:hypothetical protein
VTFTRDNVLLDYWAVRDGEGMLHRAMVRRSFDLSGKMVHLEASTACHPVSRRLVNMRLEDWAGTNLPRLYLSGHPEFTIVEWRVHEIPTCLACVSVDVPDAWTASI